eukprot:Nk52_evm6s106 gene=Nk52_evmTU6s106
MNTAVRGVCALAALAVLVLACCSVSSAEQVWDETVFEVVEVTPGEDGSDRCTSTAAGKLATDGLFTALTYTADCKECDNRVVHIPAMKHDKGSKKKIIDSLKQDFPRYVGEDRGEWYRSQSADEKESPARGSIPEVEKTYAYFDSVYGIMNEHGLGMGESSCYSRIAVGPKSPALFEIAELSRIALERCKDAKCAIKLMGKLAEEYGFYGPDGEFGEALTIIDDNEAWVFHISGTPDAKGAVWVAQRVPDDHIAAIGNWYVIHEVQKNSSDFMFSDNLFQLALDLKYWYGPEVEPFNFAKHYAPANKLPTYTTRRVWRVFDLAAPSLGLDGNVVEDLAYPFSVKVDKKLPLSFFMSVNRDFYEGTEFDLTKGLAAGPFGTPFRQEFKMLPGQAKFERAISIHRTSYSLVIQNRHGVDASVGAVAWVAPDAPHASCYLPHYAGAKNVSESYAVGSLKSFSRNAWWAFDFVANFINLKFSYMIQDVRAMQKRMEDKYMDNDRILIKEVTALKKDGKVAEAFDKLTKYVVAEGFNLVSTWWKFSEQLIVKYNDGYLNLETGVGQPIPYPEHWMELYTEEYQSKEDLLSELKQLKAKVAELEKKDSSSKTPSKPASSEKGDQAPVAPVEASVAAAASSHFGAIFAGIVVGVAAASAMFVVVQKRNAAGKGYSLIA